MRIWKQRRRRIQLRRILRSSLEQESTMLYDIVDPLLQLNLQDTIPLDSLAETPAEWVPHTCSLTWLVMSNRSNENKEVHHLLCGLSHGNLAWYSRCLEQRQARGLHRTNVRRAHDKNREVPQRLPFAAGREQWEIVHEI